MKTEAKEGDEILASGSIEVMPGPRGSGKARIRFSEHEAHWFHLDTLIPIDPRLVGVEVEEEPRGVAVGSSERVGDSLVGFHEIIPPKQWEEYKAAKATLDTLHPDIGDREVMSGQMIDAGWTPDALDVIYRKKPEEPEPTLIEQIDRQVGGQRKREVLTEAVVALIATVEDIDVALASAIEDIAQLEAKSTPPPPGDTPRKS